MKAAAAQRRDWSVYDAPALVERISAARGNGRHEMLVRVEGLHCVNCVRNLERALAPVTRQARVDLGAGTAEVIWDEDESRPSAIFAAVEAAGYRPSPLMERADLRTAQSERRALLLRLGVAGLLGMQVMMLAATQYFLDVPPEPALAALMRYAQWALATPVLLYSGWPFFERAWAGLRARSLNMDVPVALALLLAYVASCVNTIGARGHVYFDSVTMFAFLLLVARWFEGSGRATATRRLRELEAVQVLSAVIEGPGGERREVPVARLSLGDVVVTAPGAALAADGVLLDRSAALDESLLSGESLPAERGAGQTVYAGSINAGLLPLRTRVASLGADTVLSQINRLVHRAQAEKPRVQQLADRIAGWIVLGVLLAAGLGAAAWSGQGAEAAFNVALAVLVVTCPCALSLATPLALAAASSHLAARGVLLVRADALLQLAGIDTVCFDKTGTLSTGRMRVQAQHTAVGEDPDACLRIAAALERDIRHPVASAFADVPSALRAEQVELLPGLGMEGNIGGLRYHLGACTEDQGHTDLTWLCLCCEGEELARFGLAHQLRAESPALIRRLKSEGLRVQMLSGDAPGVVQRTAQALGIDEAWAAMKPADKLRHLAQLQQAGHRVWMIGDGINDAPVLAAADVSASLAGASALAQARADLLLMRDRLDALPQVLELARRARRIVHQNLAWAALYNLVAVPLALAGLVTPWLAALGMGASSVTVVLNALRLMRVPAKAERAHGATNAQEHPA